MPIKRNYRGYRLWSQAAVIFLTFGALFILAVHLKTVIADELQKVTQELNDTIAELGEVSAKIEQYKKDQSITQAELNALQSRIDGVRANLVTINENLLIRRDELREKFQLRDRVVRAQYQSGRLTDIEFFLLNASNMNGFQYSSLAYIFDKSLADEALKVIDKLNTEISNFEKDKAAAEKLEADLEIDQQSLIALKIQLDTQRASAEQEADVLEDKIAELSAKQQQLLADKFDSAPVPHLAYTALAGCSSDVGKSSGFSPRFGFFSYGVPNKIGLNQYGAKGRAEDGQDYEEILEAYYKDFKLEDYNTDITIKVNGKNPYGQTFNNEKMDLEEYLEHLYEMPAAWDEEALKAQAVAARTYALYITDNGKKTIVPNESNQVVKKEKNSSSWVKAVKATKGEVMTRDGKPIGAWYSSTHGGVVLKSGQIGWSETPWTRQAIDADGSVNSFSSLQSKAYDQDSPWFYCDWGYRKQYNNTAWLKESEVVDIVNSYLLWEENNNNIVHLSQTDKPTDDTWSADRVREKLGSKAISSIDSISVEWDSSGISKTIKINGKSYNAQKFKNMFNLRAPANIQIKPTCQPNSALNCPAMYALFDVEVED